MPQIGANKRHSTLGFISIFAGIAAVTTTAWGQQVTQVGVVQGDTGGQSIPDTSKGGGELTEIIVSARRRSESIEDVPISITAVSQQELDSQQITSATDLMRLAPSLVAQGGINRNSESFTIRGIGQAPGGGGASAGVITYFADVPITAVTTTGSIGVNGVYFDLQDVQILRGPQGTLFGKNTTGGAVLFEPNRPTSQLEGDIEVGLGDYGMNSFKGMINIPLVNDKLSVRIAASVFRRDGFTKDVGPDFPGKEYDNKDQSAVRGGILFTPTNFIENYTLLAYTNSETNGTGFKLSAVAPNGALAAIYGNQATNALAQQQSIGPRATSLDLDEGERNRNSGVTNTTKVKLGSDLVLKNIAGYQSFKYLTRADWDGSELGAVERVDPQAWSESIGQLSDELQLQGTSFSKALDWTVGTYYDDTHPRLYNQVVQYFLGTPATVTRNNYVGQWDRSNAGYGQATYDVSAFLPGVKITGGYRYTREAIEQKDNAFFGNGACNLKPGFVAPNCETNYGLTDSASIYNADLDYEFAPKTHAYITVHTGFKSGGFNPNAPPGFESFRPEHVTAYEAGLKSNFAIGEMKGRLSADAYESVYTDIQLLSFTVDGGALEAYTSNNGRAHIKGFECEGAVFPVTSVELSVSYAYTNAYYLVPPADAPAGFKTLPNAPKNTAALTGRYHFPIPDLAGDLSFGATYSYQSADYRGAISAYTLYSGYGLLNTDLAWNKFLGKPMDLDIFVTNATNKIYQEGGINVYSALGYNVVYYGPPRMWGARLNYHF
jgi:iron complex outermembrane recepter protein